MTRGTVIMAALALLSALGAYMMRPVEIPPAAFEDTGEPLFPDFVDPNVATHLEVREYDDEAAQLTRFSVKLEPSPTGGQWVIPSHNNYPADGTEQMGKAAASFIGVKKDVVRSDAASDHAEFGVIDPEDPGAAKGTRGRRVTIKDESGTTLVDVIIGRDLPDRQGFKFIRYPGQNRVYAVQIDPKVSTKFTDWIEDDLLKMESDDIVAVLSNSYSVDDVTDPESGKIITKLVNDEPYYFELQDGAIGADGQPMSEWALVAPPAFGPDGERIDPATYTGEPPLPEAQPIPEGKALNPTKVKQIVGAADRMKIVGVRPRSQRLDPFEMQAKGFFLIGERAPYSLLADQGEVRLFSRDGVVYSLFFGEVTYATGEALSAGGEDEQPTEEQGDNSRANRYMFVNVSYDPRHDQTKDEPPIPGEVRGKARAELLNQRFSAWYYVIQDYSFTQVHKVPSDFWKDAS